MGGRYYACALKAMIKEWRSSLEQLSLPFLVVESPVYCNENDFRTWHSWCNDRHSRLKRPDEHLPEMRLAQNEAEELDQVYVVSAMDQGNLVKALGGSIHSVAKRDLGIRVSLAARSAVYGEKQTVWTGPRPHVAWRADFSHVSICFDTGSGGGLVLNESNRCPKAVLPVYCTGATFELEINGTWRPPVTSITCGRSVVLKLAGHDALSVTRVRYAWADWPVNSLYSEAGLPARLFNMPVEDDAGVAAGKCPAMLTAGTAVAPGAVCGSDGDSRLQSPTEEALKPLSKDASASTTGLRGYSREPEFAPQLPVRSRESRSDSSSSSSSRSSLSSGKEAGLDPSGGIGGSRTALTVSLIVSLVVILPLFWVMSASIVSCFKQKREHCPVPGRDPSFTEPDSGSVLYSPSSNASESKMVAPDDACFDRTKETRLMVMAAVPIVTNGRNWDQRCAEDRTGYVAVSF